MRVVCPVCLGRFTLEGRYHQTDVKCFLCGGNGHFDNECVCECGRPVTRIVNKTMICTFVMCEKRATEKKTDTATTQQDNFNEMYGVG